MHPDVGALLAVQDDDVVIRRLETQLAQLGPQLDALVRERDSARAQLDQATQAAEAEEKRRHEVATRVSQHRTLQEKNQATLNTVTSMREATAATAQLEQAKRMIDEDERELAAIGQRLVAARKLAEDRSHILADLEAAQEEKHSTLSADRRQLTLVLVDHSLGLLELRGRRGRLAHRRHAVQRLLILFLQRAVLRDPRRDIGAATLLGLG